MILAAKNEGGKIRKDCKKRRKLQPAHKAAVSPPRIPSFDCPLGQAPSHKRVTLSAQYNTNFKDGRQTSARLELPPLDIGNSVTMSSSSLESLSLSSSSSRPHSSPSPLSRALARTCGMQVLMETFEATGKFVQAMFI